MLLALLPFFFLLRCYSKCKSMNETDVGYILPMLNHLIQEKLNSYET